MQLRKNGKINNFEKRLDFLRRIVYNSWATENPADADYHLTTRRVVRVAEGAALEMLCTFSGTEGSNPSLYANPWGLRNDCLKPFLSFLFFAEFFVSFTVSFIGTVFSAFKGRNYTVSSKVATLFNAFSFAFWTAWA